MLDQKTRGHRLVDRWQATQVVKFGDRRSFHAPVREEQQRCLDSLVEVREGPDAGDFCAGREDLGGVSTPGSKGCWKISGKIFRRQVVPTMVVAPERLYNDCNTTGVRHNHWIGR